MGINGRLVRVAGAGSNRAGVMTMRLGRISLSASVGVALLVAFGAGTAAAATPRPGGPVVVTTEGAVRGRVVGGVDEFLGVPYAAPPVGPLRWRAPQPAARWTGVRDATRFAPHCAQPPSPLGGGTGSEDCLYLNVFAAGGTQGPRPVMLWIHGGGLTTGESDD